MPAATRPIKIEKINDDGTLVLSDHGNTTASRGDTILWIIGPNSGVFSIEKIHHESGDSIFITEPGKQPGESSSWSGTIKQDLKIPSEQTYCIHYTTTKSGPVIKHDPKIQVDS